MRDNYNSLKLTLLDYIENVDAYTESISDVANFRATLRIVINMYKRTTRE